MSAAAGFGGQDEPRGLRIAREVKERDWRPFPVDHPSLEVCAGTGKRCRENRERDGDCRKKQRGKHPVGNWGTMTSGDPSTDATLRLWFGSEPRNVGIACGPSGLVVLDEDRESALANLADELGEEVPATYRVRTSRGWHYYFSDESNEFGNGAGALADHDIDVRGGHGDGGYVLAAGSIHWTGVEYLAEDSAAGVAPLPDWIKEQLRKPSSKKAESAGSDGGQREWNDRPRYGRSHELLAQYDRHLADVRALRVPEGQRPNGGDFRHALFLAGLDGWRLADCGLIDEHTMLTEIGKAIREVWRSEPDDSDREIVYKEARERAMRSPWVVIDGAEGSSSDKGAAPNEDALLETEVKRERARRKAKSIVDAEEAPELIWWDIGELLASPKPKPLIQDFLYLDSLTRTFGAAGSAKTFVELDMGLHVALGRSWAGREVVQGPVVYVMAEGQAVNNERVEAWMNHHGVTEGQLTGRFITVPHAVLLTPPALKAFLGRVAQLKPVLVILDTKNAMAVGDENSASDVALMRRAMDLIRTSCGCCVSLIDHTGYSNTDRGRGSSAVMAAMDTEIKVEKDGNRVTVEVTRDKARPEGTTVDFTLRWYPPAAVLQLNEGDRPKVSGDWRAFDLPERLRTQIAEYSGPGEKHLTLLARFMAGNTSGNADVGKVGFTRTEALGGIGLTTKNGSGRDAWSWLLGKDWIQAAEGTSSATGRHIWHPLGGGQL